MKTRKTKIKKAKNIRTFAKIVVVALKSRL